MLKQVSQRRIGKCLLHSSVRHLDGEINAYMPSGRRAFCGGGQGLREGEEGTTEYCGGEYGPSSVRPMKKCVVK